MIKKVRADNKKLRRMLPVLEMKKVTPKWDSILFEKIIKVYNANKSPLGYCSYWHCRKLGTERVFSCLKAYWLQNPYKIRFGVNRAGKNVYFRLL